MLLKVCIHYVSAKSINVLFIQFPDKTVVSFKYRKQTGSIPIEKYRRKNIILESEVVIQRPPHSCD